MDRKRLEALVKLQEVAAALTQELEMASKQLVRAHRIRRPSHPIHWETAFAGKTALRSLFGHAGALGSSMRFLAVDLAQEMGAPIPEQPQRDAVDPAASLQSTFRDFSTLFEVEIELDFSTEHGKAFLALAEIRNEMVRPKTLEQLAAWGVYPFWAPGYLWYLSQVGDLMSRCALQIPEAALASQTWELPEYTYTERPEAPSADDDNKDAGPHSLSVLDHAWQAFEVLVEDTSRAMGLASKVGAHDLLFGEQGQFGMRNLVRTFFAEVEGTIAIASSVLADFGGRSELAMSDQDLEDLATRSDLDQKLVEVTRIWSEDFGYQGQIETGGKKWTAFRQALKCRDRIAHPKAAKDLRVSLEELDAVLRGQEWLQGFMDLYMDAKS